MIRLNRYALSILALSVMAAIIAGVNATPTQVGPTVVVFCFFLTRPRSASSSSFCARNG